ncbi:hypothetical protein PACTADRAFT_37503 [Pachysolen tannophilus NRRL Y-2460]|uniref:Translocation protein SEC66 n=1 Tax=Pachysolen tannophilus NRRL Y-2460 TaxID=669874 RepID=A0A1E4U0S7_PACTA|nr:hypothetical protein PACTADRAFT_37503 [Pachysolen tannophilus NRRL Y-2460]
MDKEDSFNSESEFDYEKSYDETFNQTFFNSTSDEQTKPQFIRISIYTPIIYFSVLIAILISFSIFYRRRKFNKLTRTKSIFPENLSKELYIQLKNSQPKPNEKVLKAALIRRGSEAFKRMFKIKESEVYINTLYQKGAIGDECFESFGIDQKLNELEFKEIAIEAETIKKGWGQVFFQVCQEVTFNEALRRRLNVLDNRKEDLLTEWGIAGDIAEEKILKQKNGKKQ